MKHLETVSWKRAGGFKPSFTHAKPYTLNSDAALNYKYMSDYLSSHHLHKNQGSS